MKIRTRLILLYLILVSAGFYYFVDWVLDDLRKRYMESVEETLIDTARILSAVVTQGIQNESLPLEDFHQAFNQVYQQRFLAKVYEFEKKRVDLRVFITNEKGKVIFDSDQGKEENKDYSKWNDVLCTMKGLYGARSSLLDPKDPASSALFVAAPIQIKGKRMGVLSVCKPKKNILNFLHLAKKKILWMGILAGASVIFMGILLSVWLTRPIQKLGNYMMAIRDGQKTQFPQLGNSEIGTLGNALEEMRIALEGKKYIEHYLHTLTHELKSPISAIQGSAELLKEEMPTEQRIKFLDHILKETVRLKEIIERLLLLSSLENRTKPLEKEEFDLRQCVLEVLEGLNPLIVSKQLEIHNEIKSPCLFQGEKFLIYQSLVNLLQNAIDFSKKGDRIDINLEPKETEISLTIEDQGLGIPEFALPRVFEPFYSLPRPDTNRKSTGLGLSFVKQAMELHQGSVILRNRTQGGVTAVLILPLSI